MKKRVITLAVAMSLFAAAAACGKAPENNIVMSESLSEDVHLNEAADDTKNVSSEKEAVAFVEQENNKEEVAPEEPAENLTFKDLSTRQFYFSSGAGAWGEDFVIEKDGYFTGKYHDSEMGENGEEYPGGNSL